MPELRADEISIIGVLKTINRQEPFMLGGELTLPGDGNFRIGREVWDLEGTSEVLTRDHEVALPEDAMSELEDQGGRIGQSNCARAKIPSCPI